MSGRSTVRRFSSGRRSRGDQDRRDEERQRVDPDRERLLSSKPKPPSASKPPSHFATPASAANIDRAERERAVRGDERRASSPTRAARVLHDVRHRRVLRRAPQQREHLDAGTRARTSPSRLSKNGSSASSPARPMSQLTITTLRFHRSTSAPPSGARKKPGQHPRDHHEADRGARARHLRREREDRDEPDPVAEARHDLREPEPHEPRHAEHRPRRAASAARRGGRE